MAITASTKACLRCGLVLPVGAFAVRRASVDGLVPHCRGCASEKARRYRAQNRQRHTDNDPRELTPEKRCTACGVVKGSGEFDISRTKTDGLCTWCKGCRTARAQIKYAENGATERRTRVLARFDLTVEQYDALLAEQGGGCAICGTTEPGGRWNSYFAVDHDHATGDVRGLLCSHCNVMLGNAADDPSRLRAGASYLERGL